MKSTWQKIAGHYGISMDDSALRHREAAVLTDFLAALCCRHQTDLPAQPEPETLLADLEKEQARRLVEPVLVVQEKEIPLCIPLRLTGDDRQHYIWTLVEEQGHEHHGTFMASDLPPHDSTMGGDPQHPVLVLDLELAQGYHHFRVIPEDESAAPEPGSELLLIVAPPHCYVPPGLNDDNRIWGLSAHLHAVRSRSNWGIGDFSDLLKIINHSAGKGAGTLHTAPLYTCLAEPPRPPNPYSPSCRTLLNELHIDIEAMADFSEWNLLNEISHDAEFQARLAMLKDAAQIDYEAITQIKTEVLGKLWDHFSDNHLNPETTRGRQFRDFQSRGGTPLRHYGIFAVLYKKMAADHSTNTGWRSWPAQFQDIDSPALADFAEQHSHEIEYHHYVQWQADLQLAAIGRRSMELSLKLGLIGEFPYTSHANGFESWYYQGTQLEGAVVASQPHGDAALDPAVGLPALCGPGLRQQHYQPLILALQQAMRYSGALLIRSLANYHTTFFNLADGNKDLTLRAKLSFADIIGIIALESHRNRCLVIADTTELLPPAEQKKVQDKKIFASYSFFQGSGEQEDWPDSAAIPPHSLLCSSTPFLLTVKGFWNGHDIALKSAEHLFADESQREKAIIARGANRAHFLINLHHENLLPHHHPLDPAAIPSMDQALIMALQLLLAKSRAKILLITINDLLGLEEQAEPPLLAAQHFWQTTYPLDLEDIFSNQENSALFKALYQERGKGSVRPSAKGPDAHKRLHFKVPRSFYRLQLHKGFSFQQATAIIPYLSSLGISHCYISPILAARPGSSHGYDIINHAAINPELGNREDFEGFLAALEQHDMALILDIVPNHMGVGSDNHWWMDVLENGRASRYAHFFDINWQPQQAELRNRLLVPFLGDYYGKVLEEGLLSLSFQEISGTFVVNYYEHIFPIDPRSYAIVLSHDLHRLEERLGPEHHGFQELQNLIEAFASLPAAVETSTDKMQTRRRHKEVNKRLLARLCREIQEIPQFIEENVILFNGMAGQPASFDMLHDLLEEQSYRLAYWRVAADEINYRRFFDINDLAGLRMEEAEVFRQTHGLVLDLINTGKLDGLRIDHPDGLYDPLHYFCRLQAAASGEAPAEDDSCLLKPSESAAPELYVVMEKILADFEHICPEWPVSGSTGYDFANLVNGLFINSAAEEQLTAAYQHFTGDETGFEELVYQSKKKIIRSSLAGELNVLASLLYRLAQGDRITRDFTFNRLRDGLIEIVCFFPVYRTYISSGRISKHDRRYIDWAAAAAKKSRQMDDTDVLDFITAVLLLETRGKEVDAERHLDFVMKFQQYTGPVMAKGLEDTSFYRYNRLLSLNEVGGEPRRFGLSMAAFHRTNQDRMHHWPHSMINTSTHDSKRNEDARARINLLSEMAEQWQERVFSWRQANEPLKSSLADDGPAPSAQDEYAFYQNLLAAWPFHDMDRQEREHFTARMQEAMLKASREAKVETSWIDANAEYEEALQRFIAAALAEPTSPFMTDFIAQQQSIAWFGMLNALSQVFLKLTAPGIPDIYQGNEIWRFCLVDPDNRRPVDFEKRQAMLFAMLDQINAAEPSLHSLQQELLANLSDGRAKLYTIAQTLRLRNSQPDTFSHGAYIPLEVTGSKARHLCAFARKRNNRAIMVVAPRFCLTLLAGRQILPLGLQVWDDTTITLPPQLAGMEFDPLFAQSAAGSRPEQNDKDPSLTVGRLLHSWPLALLQGTTTPPPP